MNERAKLVLQILKPKAKSLGFNKAELQGVAKDIADNLESADDAEEDDVKAEIETAVTAAVRYLSHAQKMANRVIEENRKKEDPTKKSKKEEDDDDEDIEENSQVGKLVKALRGEIANLSSQVKGLAAEKSKGTRKLQIQELVKETGKYGSQLLKNFDKMSFETDEEFGDYLDELKADVEDYKQEMANAGLTAFTGKKTAPGNTGGSKKLTDAEVQELADTF